MEKTMRMVQRSFVTPRRLVSTVLGMLALAACSGDGARTDAGARDVLPGTDTAARAGGLTGSQAGALTDGDIAAILAAADQAEIQPSQLAQGQAQNPQVREYAQRMVTDHTTLSDSLRALAQRQNIAMQENDVSRKFQMQTDSVRQHLQGLSGAEFDRAYMQFMVDSHQMTLHTIEERLIPSAQNPQLRTALEQQVRPAVSGHLQEARQLHGNLGTR